MKWINDRDPASPGMYAITYMFMSMNGLYFAYWDGKGWMLPSQANEDMTPYRNRPTWAKIEWGKDELYDCPYLNSAQVP